MYSFVRQMSGLCGTLTRLHIFQSLMGLKQGGVNSPIMFNLYNLLILLKQSGIGCHINRMYMDALWYTVDITLLCPSLYGL